MGAMCAKNNAGDAAGDVPQGQKPIAKSEPQTQYVSAGSDFKAESTDDKTIDQVATEKAEAWIKLQSGEKWTYTGVWKTEKEGDADVSFFQVQKVVESLTASAKQKGDMPMSMPQNPTDDKAKKADEDKDKDADKQGPADDSLPKKSGVNEPNVPMD